MPDDWSKKQFKQALKASRRYSDRMLILNNYQIRFPHKEVDYYEELFSSYLLNSSYVAAIYYGEKLEKKLLDANKRKLAELYQALVEWVKVKSKYQVEDKDSLSPAFLEQLRESKSVVKFQNSWPVLKQASFAWFALYGGREKGL